MYQHYDIPKLVKNCRALCKVDVEELQEFELSTDFDHLSNTMEIRCYLHCASMELRIMKPGSSIIDPTEFFDVIDQMTEEEQNKMMKMMRGCSKRVAKIKDPVEIVYQALVCMKENANEVN